uniref:Uncharacterized protein n=1 Tax=Oryza punctata TaxID=4537 RepID=A0A0E0JQ20_ORYPU
MKNLNENGKGGESTSCRKSLSAILHFIKSLFLYITTSPALRTISHQRAAVSSQLFSSSRSFRCHGRPARRGADCRVQGGLQPLRQGRRRSHHHQGARNRDAYSGPEPDGGGAAGHDQRGGRGRQRQHRLPGVPGLDGTQAEGQGLGGGAEGGVPRLRQGSERLHLRRGAPPRDGQHRGAAHRRGGRRDDPRGRPRRRRADQLRGVRQVHDGQEEEEEGRGEEGARRRQQDEEYCRALRRAGGQAWPEVRDPVIINRINCRLETCLDLFEEGKRLRVS